jgi:hypothetical protein
MSGFRLHAMVFWDDGGRETLAGKRAAKLPKPGSLVSWETSQGKTTGIVTKIVTCPTSVKGHTANATPEHPQAVVKSRKSGKLAIHTPAALKPV